MPARGAAQGCRLDLNTAQFGKLAGTVRVLRRLMRDSRPPSDVRQSCGSSATRDLVALSQGQHPELVAIGIGHDHPADLAPVAETSYARPVSCQGGVSDHRFWAVQSLVTEPGTTAAAIDRLPSDLGALRAASQQLVFHYWADGDWAENGIAPERISEIDTRYAAAMFARLGELSDLPLSAARQPRQRLVGCCRDFTVLFVAMVTSAITRSIASAVWCRSHAW